jgi:hypothetical protein
VISIIKYNVHCGDGTGTSFICEFAHPCSEVSPSYEPLSLQLGESWQFNVSSQDYLIDSKDELGNKKCLLGLVGADIKFYILGDSFLRSFVSVFDFDKKRIGLALQEYSQGSITEIEVETGGMKPWLIAVISVSSVLVLIIVILVICKIRKNKKAKLQQEFDATDASLIHGGRV